MLQIDHSRASGMAPPSSRSRPGGGGGVLPPLTLDAVYEVLLRLAARELCRLHAVSRPWRALLSDPQFVSAHAACHPGPLVVACYGPSSGYPEGDILCEIMDLSGRVVKRIRAMGDGIRKDWVVSAQLDFVQIVREMSSYRLLDPATGAIFALPEELADEDTALQLDMYKYRVGVAFGKVASTGKVLHVSVNTFVKPSSSEQLFEVFTLDGSSDARWRANKGPPHPIDVRLNSTAVVNGIVYFFVNEDYWYDCVKVKFIASFDLETEDWRKTLQGPLFRFEGSFPDLPSNHINFNQLSLASLNGCSWDVWFGLEELIISPQAPHMERFITSLK
ncbi:hypothetical protein PAHAL_2G065800 [Panicum hallii]|jgi:hypothetical protein|uniref:F-box domain-containing protein n=2 Tax=Panicum hallii TaxID=206008 RepID=A0A2S3GWC2_9POAL|nr:hypothetical protein PAHAL_2G065800 [Panicum hallii]